MNIGERFNPRGLFHFLAIPDAIAKCKVLRAFDKLLYGKLAEHLGQNRQCWPSSRRP